jgi:hypothetical protein
MKTDNVTPIFPTHSQRSKSKGPTMHPKDEEIEKMISSLCHDTALAFIGLGLLVREKRITQGRFDFIASEIQKAIDTGRKFAERKDG